MDVSAVVASKLSRDRELLHAIRQARPEQKIDRVVLLKLEQPEMPGRPLSREQTSAAIERMRQSETKAEQGFARIKDLEVHNLMKGIGMASIGGTAEAIVKTMEMDCVKEAIFGDKPVFPMRGIG